ncbi:MAG: glycerophosphodiester phosphodiesterase [Chloroflexi bacterium]|nr:MAG: glycerophosphodiester phosphodiesterase [Chloroflexota bacterium]PIE81289.1 MAG: glycerophosphodiester phosphodiesterase [Chloroflexota bacterium]
MRRGCLLVFLGAVAILLIVVAVFALNAKAAENHSFFDQDECMVIAHQGGEKLRPSNTMIAFEHAVDLGVDVLEMDIHQTKDGVLVVMHDDTVDRTTNGSGRIKEMTLAEIKELDAGHYWTDDDGATYPYRGQGVTVPTLDEVFQAFPDMPMNIEIKQQSPSIVEPFCALIHEYGMIEQVLIPTFYPDTMNEFREKCPGVATAMTEPEIQLFFGLNKLGLSSLYSPPGEAFQVPETFGNWQVITPSFVEGAQERNLAVHVWTVDDPADMERLLEIGVDGIITDRPDLLLEILGRKTSGN